MGGRNKKRKEEKNVINSIHNNECKKVTITYCVFFTRSYRNVFLQLESSNKRIEEILDKFPQKNN